MSGNEASKLAAKTDRRIERTRDVLGEALMLLMQEKPFDEITVQQVLDRAGVGRSTFYVHYRDKDDLFFSEIEEFLKLCAGALNGRGADVKRLAPVAEFFGHIAESKQLVSALIASGKAEDVWELGRGIFARSIEDRLRTAGAVGEDAVLAAQSHAISGSLFALLDWWLRRGSGATALEMDAIFHRMAWGGIEVGSR